MVLPLDADRSTVVSKFIINVASKVLIVMPMVPVWRQQGVSLMMASP